jgi:hypothetical protein
MVDGRLPFIVTITLIVLAAAFTADAQEPPKIYRIGLQVVSPRDLNATRIETFRQGLSLPNMTWIFRHPQFEAFSAIL